MPVADLGVQRGMQITYGLADMPKPAEMLAIAEPWAPFRSVGTWYMWRALGVMVPEQGRGYTPDEEKKFEP
jgi:3-methyladenine DNA glycosylase/8-oxoguanine DNA glycosylase